jgi:DNA-binding transcriptional MerR regulator
MRDVEALRRGEDIVTDINGDLTGSSGGYMIAASSSDPEPDARPDEKKFTIGELSREFGVTLRTLRFYENKGLIAPHRRGATRLYSGADRDRIAQILAGKRLGFTLAEIRRMVEEKRAGSDGDLEPSREKCLEQIALLEEQKRGIEAALVELRTIYAKLSADSAEPGAITS